MKGRKAVRKAKAAARAALVEKGSGFRQIPYGRSRPVQRLARARREGKGSESHPSRCEARGKRVKYIPDGMVLELIRRGDTELEMAVRRAQKRDKKRAKQRATAMRTA